MVETRPIIAAYHFPQWHIDPRNEQWHGAEWTEWELVLANPVRFPGHRPLKPAWGCHDEADPVQMAREIDLAADRGIDAFLFDVYWYEDGPFLDRAITAGFLKAPNRSRIRFACMWANHTWRNWHPCQASQHPWHDAMLQEGSISVEAWRRFAERIAAWMSEPNYLCLGDRPYFSIYQVKTFLSTCGSLDRLGAELAWFRQQVRARTGRDPHVGVVGGAVNPLGLSADDLRRVGFDSVTPYNQLDHYALWDDAFPLGSWAKADAANRANWSVLDRATGLPCIPNITVGWDSSARCVATDRWEKRMYPWMPILPLDANRFRRELEALRTWFESNPGALPMATLNAWNEWTEGAVLLPITDHGSTLLEQVRDVFGLSGKRSLRPR